MSGSFGWPIADQEADLTHGRPKWPAEGDVETANSKQD